MRGLLALVLAAMTLSALAGGALAGTDGTSRTIYFQSPSHNIACAMLSDGVRCDIRNHSWQTPPKPPSCEVDYGGGLSLVSRGKGHYTCAGDTLLGHGKVLGYGRSKTLGRYRCTSQTSGVRCVNSRNGHGFKLARESVKLF